MRTGAVGKLKRAASILWAGLGLCALLAGLQYWNRAALPASVAVIGWHEPWHEFGGWSGLDVSPDGHTIWAITDGSLLARATLLRNPDGRLRGIRAERRGFVTPPPQGPSQDPEDRTHRDAESLSLSPDGVPLVSFEREPRLLLLPQSAAPRAYPPLLQGVTGNSGVEALALGADGTRYSVPERPPAFGWPYTLWADTGEGWRRLGQIPRAGRWRAAGADIGPDGALYLLERGITLFGFVSRVRRLHPDTPGQTDTVYLSPPGRHGNLEGLGVWRDRAGHLRLLMIADDNFYWFQRGGIVEVTLPLAPAPARG